MEKIQFRKKLRKIFIGDYRPLFEVDGNINMSAVGREQ